MIYAINILNRIRIATRDVVIKETISNTEYSLGYRPAIQSITPPKDVLSIERERLPEIPTAATKVADPDRAYFSILNERRIDDIPVSLMRVSEAGEVVDTLQMTLTDLVWDSGILSFDLRGPEDIVETSYMEAFTPVSFQWIEIPQVVTVATTPTWTKQQDVPWKILGVDFRRAYFESGGAKSELGLKGLATYDTEILGISYKTKPAFGLTPEGVDPSDAYAGPAYTTTPPYYFDRDSEYPLKIRRNKYNRIPINKLYQPYYASEVINYEGSSIDSIRKTGGSIYFDEGAMIYDNTSTKETIFDGNVSFYYDFINNLVMTDYAGFTAGDFVPYGTDIPAIDGANSILESATDEGTRTYRYAQVGCSSDGNAEIIAYIVAGAGCLWVDSSGDWWWRSGGQVIEEVNGEPKDLRMYHLSGIPSENHQDPLDEILGTPTSGIEEFAFKREHFWREPIWPANTGVSGSDQASFSAIIPFSEERHTFDRVLINTNNFTPDPDNDPDFSSGYLWLGQKQFGGQRVVNQEDAAPRYEGVDPYKLFLRYKIKSIYSPASPPYLFDVRDLSENNERADNARNPITLAELQIHNRSMDTDNDYGVLLESEQGAIELPDPQDPRMKYYDNEEGKDKRRKNDRFSPFLSEDEIREQPIELYQVDFYVSVVKVAVTNLDVDTLISLSSDEEFRNSFTDRYRGLRIDQVLNIEELRADVSSATTYTDVGALDVSGSVSVEAQGASILSNATERFGVIKSSVLVVTDPGPTAKVYEWLFFHIPSEGGYQVRIEENENPADDATKVQTQSFEDAKKKFKSYTNRLSYRPKFDTALDQQRGETVYDYGRSEANEYFLSTNYRIIHDPVPENSSDLGRKFPILYGRVVRAPLMHVISKKTLYEDDETAGDDIYVYASHPCDVYGGHDIIIEYDVEEKTAAQSDEEIKERQRANLSLTVAKSPFPSYEDNHTEYNGASRRRSGIRLWLPYHALVERETITGRKVFGIRLRGSEWRSEAGKGDKRYPIRNGLGNTKVYFTAGGWVDLDGEIVGHGGLIEHPVDVTRHFLRHYGRKPYNDSALDLRSAYQAKSQTPDYRVSIFMDEELSPSEFLAKINTQFCLFLGSRNNEIVFFSPTKLVDKRKPLIDRLNIIGKITENMDGYKSAVTEITYRYGLDRPTGNFKHTISLNPNNNSYLASAAKKLQNKNRLEIDADWVSDHTTAAKVSLEMARIFSAKRRYFTLTISRDSGIIPDVGDLIPLTSRDLRVYKIPCYVVSLQEQESGLIDLELLSFEDSQAAPSYILPPAYIAPEPVTEPPVYISGLSITGGTTQGDTLYCSHGIWDSDPAATFDYFWFRTSGPGAVSVGTNSDAYSTTTGDIGESIYCIVRATNPYGFTEQTSDPLGPIASASTSPVNATPPSIAGIMRIGETLTSTPGVWTGTPTPAITGQWRRDGVDILLETSTTYFVVAADIDAEITYVETATNIAGSISEPSNVLTSPWRDILVAKPGALIFDGLDPHCYGGVSIGSPVTDYYTVNGILIGSQGISGSKPTRGTASLVFDGIDDYVVANAHAAKFNAASTAVFGFSDPNNDSVTTIRTFWSVGQSNSSSLKRQIHANYTRPSATNLTRMRTYIVDSGAAATIPLMPLAPKGLGPYDISFRFGASGESCQVDDMTNPLTIVSSAVTRPNDEVPNYNWLTIGARGVGVAPTYSQYWEGKVRHFLIDTGKYTEPEILVYRTCAIAAGVMV